MQVWACKATRNAECAIIVVRMCVHGLGEARGGSCLPARPRLFSPEHPCSQKRRAGRGRATGEQADGKGWNNNNNNDDGSHKTP